MFKIRKDIEKDLSSIAKKSQGDMGMYICSLSSRTITYKGQLTTEQLGSNLATMASRKYTVPDKTVASQVLMYRQLLHTACKPGLRLSRPYEATAAQRAVVHMPVRQLFPLLLP